MGMNIAVLQKKNYDPLATKVSSKVVTHRQKIVYSEQISKNKSKL